MQLARFKALNLRMTAHSMGKRAIFTLNLDAVFPSLLVLPVRKFCSLIMKFHRSCHRRICIQAEFEVRSARMEFERANVAFHRGFGRGTRDEGGGKSRAMPKSGSFFEGVLQLAIIHSIFHCHRRRCSDKPRGRSGRMEVRSHFFLGVSSCPPSCLPPTCHQVPNFPYMSSLILRWNILQI